MTKVYSIITFIFLLVAPYYSASQDYWEIIDVPDTIQIICMAANNQNHIFLGTGGNGIDGGIYRSIDNCVSWEYLGLGNNSIYSINIDECNHIYIGLNGDLLKSEDNGNSWIQKFSGFTNIICIKSFTNGLIFANSGTGSYINVIRSLDFGETWDEVLIFPNNIESPKDFEILNLNTIFIGTTDWFDGGGVYRSVDGGDNWEHIGMYDFHCKSLEKNSNGDIFVGTYGHNTQYWLSGVYVLYNGDDEWIQLYNTLVNDMIINSDDDIYVATDDGVLVSPDNGQTFEYINEGLFEGDVDNLAIDSAGYLYASSYNPFNLAKSFEPVLTSIEHVYESAITTNYPNPFTDFTTIQWDITDQDKYIKLIITDVSGSIIQNKVIDNRGYYIYHNINTKPGILFYSVVGKNNTYSGKMLLVK